MTVTDSPGSMKLMDGGLKKLWIKAKAAMSTKSPKPQNTINQPVQSRQKEISSMTTPSVAQPTVMNEAPSILNTQLVQQMEAPEAKVFSIAGEATDEKDSEAVIPVLDAIAVDETDDLPDTYTFPTFVSRRSELANKKKLDQAHAVYERYGIPFSVTDWQRAEKTGVERVEKKTRMRVRYTCHSCQTSFGRDKICNKCSHDRTKCTECVRYPTKRTGEKSKRQKILLVEPNVPPITKGACHECKTEFSIGKKQCQICEHEICERCLRETILSSPLIAPPTESRSTLAT